MKKSASAPKDAVILHGMFSGAVAMRPLARALEKRNIYRRIHLVDIKKPSHRQVPRVYASKNAQELAQTLDQKIAKRALTPVFDVIGHSNGGYVALFLKDALERGEIDFTFTLASPKGLPLLGEIALASDHSQRVVHFRGGVDGVPFGFQHNPGDGHCVISFPDEGHSSLHWGADKNGLADVIGWANGQALPHLFVDEHQVIHLWPFCKDEAKSLPVLPGATFSQGEFTVCNGMHDAQLESLKAERAFWEGLFGLVGRTAPPGLLAHAGYRLRRYLRFRSRLSALLQEADSRVAYVRLYGKQLKLEREKLEDASAALKKRLSDVDKRLLTFYAAARKRHKQKLEEALHPLAVARAYVEALAAVSPQDVDAVTALLEEANQGFASYFDDTAVKALAREE